MANNKTNILDSLTNIVDKDGLKTDVKVAMTNETLLKLLGTLVLAGSGIAVATILVRNLLPNKHLEENRKILIEIRDAFRNK